MKRHFFLITGLVLSLALCMVSCKKEKINIGNQPAGDSELAGNSEPAGDGIIKNAVKDYDGNTYDAVRLGTQVWMASNLRTTHYADGTEIPGGTGTSYSSPRYYKPNNESATCGYFYNWKAVMHGAESSESNPSGIQGVCPNGWHVPSDAEWDQLANYCKNKSEYACNASNGYAHIAKGIAADHGWEESTKECAAGYEQSTNNITGFNAAPEGYYSGTSNSHAAQGIYTTFWGATGCDWCTYAYSHSFTYNGMDIGRSQCEKNEGLSVRCVKD